MSKKPAMNIRTAYDAILSEVPKFPESRHIGAIRYNLTQRFTNPHTEGFALAVLAIKTRIYEMVRNGLLIRVACRCYARPRGPIDLVYDWRQHTPAAARRQIRPAKITPREAVLASRLALAGVCPVDTHPIPNGYDPFS